MVCVPMKMHLEKQNPENYEAMVKEDIARVADHKANITRHASEWKKRRADFELDRHKYTRAPQKSRYVSKVRGMGLMSVKAYSTE